MFLSKTKKSPYYYIVYENNGKRTSISTRTKNKLEALKFLQNFINDKKSAEVFNLPEVNSISLLKFENEYLSYCRQLKSEKYISSIKYSFRKLIEFTGDVSINSITVKTVDLFITTSFTRTQSGAHLFYRTLKAAFNKALEWEYIDANPFTKFKFPKLVKRQPAFISEDQLNLITANTKEQHLKDLFIVAFYTGLRLNELTYMKWNWIDLKQRLITVKNSSDFQTKSKKERIIPMSKQVHEIFFRRFNRSQSYLDGFVFYRQKGIKLYGPFVSKKFKSVVRKLNLDERIHFHTLRHSFASSLVQKGVSLYVVKELLGHSDIATTQIYSHLQTQNLLDAIAKLE
jgi:site-specific recombinase XerD